MNPLRLLRSMLADKRRMDMLESGRYGADFAYFASLGPIVYRRGTGTHTHSKTLREALDAMRELEAAHG